jgi:hypothetical protein
MTSMGTLAGLGKLWDGNKDLGPVEYEIEVVKTGELKRGEGNLRWDGHGPWDRFQSGKALMLMLKTGEQVSLTITRPGNEGAEVVATGPIPDPIDLFKEE